MTQDKKISSALSDTTEEMRNSSQCASDSTLKATRSDTVVDAACPNSTLKETCPNDTTQEFATVKTRCMELFKKKLSDYGTSWRLMRLASLTDQIYIKARRIRFIEEHQGQARVNEGILPEFVGIVNYGVIALIQSKLGPGADIPNKEAMALYSEMYDEATSLMLDKNHDYDEAWRQMRVSSFTDIILTKLRRIKQIEDHDGKTLVSEGVEAGYMDIINYSIFALIKLGYANS